MLFSDDHFEKVKNYDFYKKDKLDGMNDGLRTVKTWGDYAEKTPFVSVIVTTYKRPNDLRLALASIMRQNFHDYEIIVVDNECADIAEDTDTQKLIKEIDNPKIIYFRNLDPMTARMDRGASLARGEWICFCHDDDMLSANHLETMTSVVKGHPEINFLSPTFRIFWEEDLEKIRQNKFLANNRADGRCREVCLAEAALFNSVSWSGALIKRCLYAEMGGMPQISTGCGDNIMSNKFIYLYGGYYTLRIPLYFYRRSHKQVSSSLDNWHNTLISMYHFFRYALTKLQDLPAIDYALLCFGSICRWMDGIKDTWGMELDREMCMEKCGISMAGFDKSKADECLKDWDDYLNKERDRNHANGFDVCANGCADIPY